LIPRTKDEEKEKNIKDKEIKDKRRAKKKK
jgi:hypothetical protein